MTLNAIATVVRSPGLALDHPLLAAARAAGIAVIDELELGWRLTAVPVIAVTGTNGKSTTCALIAAVLSAAGVRAQIAGNTRFGLPLSAAAGGDAEVIVCEVSSYQLEAVDRFLPELAVLTNLTPEHLGRHRTMARYGEVKSRLFARGNEIVNRAVVTHDDALGRHLAELLRGRGATVAEVGAGTASDYRIQRAVWGLREMELSLSTPSGPVHITTRLIGRHNAVNLAGALAAVDLLNVPRSVSLAALSRAGRPPGRLERVESGQPFSVLIDLSATTDALAQAVGTARLGARPDATLRVVLGPAGNPGTATQLMGRFARDQADHLILTGAAQLGSPPVLMIASALRGARMASRARLEVVVDRRRAIARAIAVAQPGDVVLIAGRGELEYADPDPRGPRFASQDREMAAAALAELGWDSPASTGAPVGDGHPKRGQHRAQREQLGVGG